MIPNLKALGLAMVAVLAMSAVVASAAQAQFTADSYPKTVTANSALGNDVLTVDGSSVECAGHFEGTASEPSGTITITPTYTNCKAFGFASATVNMNGCDYVLHSNGDIDLVCGPGEHMTIVAGNCVVDLTSQEFHWVDIWNSGPYILILVAGTGMTLTVTKDGFLCPLNGTGKKTGTYVQEEAVPVKPVGGGSFSAD